MSSEKFTFRFVVPESAIDGLGHVNNITYLQWCLEAAEAHWLAKTDAELREQYVWVVLNHNISYKNPAFLGEEIEVQTWIHSHKGVRSERCYRIIRIADNKTLVEAKTQWCLLDGTTRKPIIIPQKVADLFV
ncbi:acyl-CoA thioesterase [Aequorivita sp. H23M31]|uniref:Acyl-CoA thioesterase n=1 Tax=Aequorivita ciconiae TaxID=2494375 RepID=A0A410G4S3_9FLAO|nr:acyl-CoA thioesterase [Aequorivita sp. H23M31]